MPDMRRNAARARRMSYGRHTLNRALKRTMACVSFGICSLHSAITRLRGAMSQFVPAIAGAARHGGPASPNTDRESPHAH
ncbi:hypothetical protein AB870_09975 [Pandoraea faecigallinarum]|uniref:Uncharacterized protein n=1 Tax=Pandoraea faecigallinarum TaxID=656179 RepID=A0A0H3WUT4_9BURK|nr:hypothetical protein AB870_09975 [Pandoraea faecigallinarum]